MLQALGELVFDSTLRTPHSALKRFHRGVANRTIAGATAEVARKLFVEIVVGVKVVAIVTFKQRTDETRCAIAALRAVALGHRALHGMRLFGTANTLYTHDLTTREQTDWHETTVHRTIRGLAIGISLHNRNGARAAIAFRAAFLRAGETGAAKIFEQGRVGGDVGDANGSAIQSKFKRTGHKLNLKKA